MKVAGFTLLELLIVIIICSLLVIFAVPQYKHATYASRYSSLFPIAKAIHTSNEVFFLSHGYYADSLDKLAVDVPELHSKKINVELHDSNGLSYVLTTRNGLNSNYVMYAKNSQMFPHQTHCEAKEGDSLANWFCSSKLHGVQSEHGNLTQGYITYIIDGDGTGGTFITHYENQSNIVLHSGDTCTASQANECQHLEVSDAECEAIGVNGGCANSSYDEGAECSTTNGGKQGCAFSEFSNNSTCTAGQAGGKSPVAGCQRSIFTSGSLCVVNQNTANAAVDTACGGNNNGGKTDTTGENSAQYYHSECINESNSSFGCGRSWYKEGSTCTSSPTNGGCGNSLFDASRCIGRGGNACDKSNFTNGSVCEARASGTCPTSGSTYDSQSYCAGENGARYSYCPVGTPAPPATPGGLTTGRKWRKCTAQDDPPKSGMSCYDD
ncbi:MAG: hypothetical protein J6Y17_04095 [Elusimicrobiaceae bacterium]|nr:hypothetical protein [Elusimicrobiaceae bacterium]